MSRHFGVVKSGEFIPKNPDQYKASFFSFEGKEVAVTVAKKVNRRSINQNSYMWGVPYKMIADKTGHTVNEIHAYLTDLLLPKKIVRGREIPVSTKDLDTKEMGEYLDKIGAWATMELELYIPLPNQIDY